MSLLLKNRGAMLLLMLNIFLAFTGIGLVVPIMPTYMNELGIGGSVVGLLVAAFSLTQLLVSPFAGRLSDKMGRKKSLSAGWLYSPSRSFCSVWPMPPGCCSYPECLAVSVPR